MNETLLQFGASNPNASPVERKVLDARLENEACKNLIAKLIECYPSVKGDYLQLVFRVWIAEGCLPASIMDYVFKNRERMHRAGAIEMRYRELRMDWVAAHKAEYSSEEACERACPFPRPSTTAKRLLNEAAYRAYHGAKAREREGM